MYTEDSICGTQGIVSVVHRIYLWYTGDSICGTQGKVAVVYGG